MAYFTPYTIVDFFSGSQRCGSLFSSTFREKLNKSKIASETSTLLGKSSKEKNVRQRKDYHNKRGTCWSRVYVYIRLDDITLPLDLGECRFCPRGE